MKKTTKRQIITVGINSLVSTSHAAYGNHIQLFYRLGRSYPNIDFCLFNPPRMSIDRMRNAAAEIALSNESTHLLFIDDDVLIPQPFDFLNKLLACDADIACGDVLIRGYPFEHMIFRYTSKERVGLKTLSKIPKERGQIPVDAVGFSLCLINCDLLKKLPLPYFVTGVSNTEDIYFCVKARKEFPDCRIICDTSITCGHILWNEIIDADNKKLYSKYWESVNGGKPKKLEGDRGQAYYNLVKPQ